ncbi:MAG: HAMP domain-containing sensor histidine kinase [Candidatus Zixiibacteriota bacterium]
MISFFKTFYGKLSLSFLVLLLAMGAVQAYISFKSSMEFVKEADQRMNRTLARDIGVEFEPLLGDTMNTDGIKHLMHDLMVMNPHIEIYLLDKEGNILAFFAEAEKKVVQERVDLAPIKDYIIHQGIKTESGDDPRHKGVRKAFTASPIHINDTTDGYIYVILGSEQYDEASAALRQGFLISTAAKGLLVVIICTGIIGLVLFFFMTRRLREMTGIVQQFEAGDFSQRLPVKSSDEFGHLGSTFNRMADTIVANIEELKRTDVLRRELIANVSHDLRSPLASINAYLETILIKYDALTNDQKKKYLETSLNNINNLNKLVSQLFELSKLDARQIEPQLEPMAISELVQDVVMKFTPSAEKKKIRFTANLDKSLPMVRADIGMIERVLSNLIDNAIRYTPENGEIRVEPTRFNSHVRVTVSDTGTGIPAEHLPYVFDRFYRGERTGDETSGGVGLGLAIAKRIVSLHNGDIKVESQPNHGTSFYFDLCCVEAQS